MNDQRNYDQQGKNVGILAMEVYTPSTFISQEKLAARLACFYTANLFTATARVRRCLTHTTVRTVNCNTVTKTAQETS